MSNRPTPAAQAPLAFPVKKHGDSNISKRTTSSPSTKSVTVPRDSLSGRKYDAVKREYSVRKAATFGEHSPLLSERESIFAEHYTTPSHDEPAPSPTATATQEELASDMPSNPASLETLTLPAPQRPAKSPHRQTISYGKNLASQPRSTAPVAEKSISSSRPTAGIRRVASDSLNSSRTAQLRFSKSGMPGQEKDADSDGNSMEQPSMPTAVTSEDVAVEDYPDQRSRPDRGASLRQALRGADRSASRGRTRVEKSIEISLANAEPVKNARSRKSSHIMGLFPAPGANDADKTGARRPGDISDSLSRTTSPETSAAVSPNEIAQGGQLEQRLLDSKEVGFPLRHEHDPYFRKQDELKQSSNTHSPSIPANLLQEIREHYVVVPPPPDYPLVSRQHSAADISDTPALREEARISQGHDRDPVREHISKVVYKPHTGRHLEEIEEGVSEPDVSQIDAIDKPAERVSIEKRRPSLDSKRSGGEPLPSEHIDVSIQSKHGKKHFHGNYQPPSDIEASDFQKPKLATIDESSTYASSPSESDFESGDELGPSDQTDGEVTPTAASGGRSPTTNNEMVNNLVQKGFANLKPYSHQAGGHSTMFKFSSRAVAKELNNRENEFYESVERRHPDLLKFLPRYLGVVNFTYTEGPDPLDASARAKSIKAEKSAEHEALQDHTNGSKPESPDRDSNVPTPLKRKNPPQQVMRIPQFIPNQNRHILPPSFLDLPERPRSADPYHGRKASAEMEKLPSSQDVLPASAGGSRSHSRPPPPDHSGSWGTTSVNEKLAQRVFREVLEAPVVHHHRRHAPGHSTLPRLRDPASRRRSNLSVETFHKNERDESDSKATMSNGTGSDLEAIPDDTVSDRYSSSASAFEDMTRLEKVRSTATVSSNGSSGSGKPSIRRRHSGMGLRRRRTSVNGNEHAELEYFDDDTLAAEGAEDVFPMEGVEETVSQALRKLTLVSSDNVPNPASVLSNGECALESDRAEHDQGEHAALVSEFGDPPLPLNPADARTVAPKGRMAYYIVLENLTWGMGQPCVLDLKMGTRQYGVQANKQKRESQRKKCRLSMSQHLGVRVCGMRTFDVRKQEGGFENKYFGRELQAGRPFQETLTRFLYDGISYSSVARHIPTVLDKIARLESMVRRLPGYRFYASSLLMIYDAEPHKSKKAQECAARQTALNEQRATKADGEGSKRVKKGPVKFEPPPIQIKMCDFANCVLPEAPLPEGTNYPPQHPGDIDRGYLRGLRTLKMYFRAILREINDRHYQERDDHDATSSHNYKQHERSGHGDDHSDEGNEGEDEDEGEVSI